MSRIQRGHGGETVPRAALCDCSCHPFPWLLGQWPCLLSGTSGCTAVASRTPSQEHITGLCAQRGLFISVRLEQKEFGWGWFSDRNSR